MGGGTRFWAGGLAGDSRIDMTLALVDEATGEVVARPRIDITSGGTAGGLSIGATDKNLLLYIVDTLRRRICWET